MIERQPDGVLLVHSFLAVTAGIIVLFLGKAVNARIRALREYSIPEPVTGGLLIAIALWLLHAAIGPRVTFELGARDVLLVYFFTTIGIDARLSDLKAGGRPLVVLAFCVTVFVPLQDVVGMAVARLLGQPPAIGVLAGSVALVGGHGTAIAWAPVFASQSGIGTALEIGVLCATAGTVLSSITGGPLARLLIERYRLRGASGEAPDVGIRYGDPEPAIDYLSFLRAILAIHLSAAIGVIAHEWLASVGFTVPLFLPCMLAGLILTNALPRLLPRVAWPTRTPALALVAEVSLGVFLAMSLMSMQLWTLASLAGPLLVLLVCQVVVTVLFAWLVVFAALGRNYDAAVTSAGFVGFALGSVSTAMAGMTAVTQRHGASHVAFIIVPLVGAFFATLLNTLVIRAFIAVL